MTVACPPLEWPANLLEAGPDEDRSILLRGMARIGDARCTVLAIRVDPISLRPDLRTAVAGRSYAGQQIKEMFDGLSSYTELTDNAVVRLQTGAYVMLVIPAGEAGFD